MPEVAVPLLIADGFPGQRMVVLPRPVVESAVSGKLPISLIPSDIGYFPNARWHYFERPGGSPQLILILCVHGQGWVRCSQKEHAVTPGQLLVIRPHRPHSYGADPRQPWSIYWCHAAGSVVAKFGESLVGDNPSPVVEISDYPRLAALFTEMLDELEQGYGFDHLLPASTGLSHLLGLIWKCSRALGDRRYDSTLRVRQVAEYLRQVPEGTVAIGALARMANLSESHFCALFKRVTGFAPIDYFLHVKVQRACDLLDTTDQPVKRIAGQVGFSDPLYFSRIFRKVQGISPRTYRSIAKG
jgi:AraC-like DNA-binding protein